MEAADLVGRWRARGGDHAIELTPTGDLVYSIVRPEGLERLLLTYRLDGHVLVTDQPSAPREERTPCVLRLDGTLVLGEGAQATLYDAEDPASPTDPDARFFALGGHALRHAVASATGEGDDDAFIPFLMLEAGTTRELHRFVAAMPYAAHDAAVKWALQDRERVDAFAYCADGRVAVPGGKRDAAIATVSVRGRDEGLVLVQPYLRTQGAAVADGPMRVGGRVKSWLRVP